ncbi:MAG: S8 family serine peptidase [Candidatus Faecousia sp.]|nr:S8 family serine peptidase [Candidatus Faecousia sp.]
MKNIHLRTRLLSWLLAAAMLLSFAVPVEAAGKDSESLRFRQTEASAQAGTLAACTAGEEEASEPADTDVVRVSVVLETPGTLDAGFSVQGIAGNTRAAAYRQSLRERQAAVTAQIQAATGEPLDVVWNLTLAANIISANVAYGQIEQIESVPGVKKVILETRYSPDVVSSGEADPDMSTSGKMIGSAAAWAAGYTGAGSRIAIIDTGIDTDHRSFDASAFRYSLAWRAGLEGKAVEDYLQELNLLDEAELSQVLEQLNIAQTLSAKNFTAQDLYVSAKIPFGFNYVDRDLDITHDHDTQTEHGSHVAGIAAANAYVPDGNGGYANALDTVKTQGVAPDAQIITMKVFGKTGGAYDSDYMVAIEDAIVLGCDAVNLSLGSGSPGYSRNSDDTYQEILDGLAESGIVATMSAGNAGSWTENSYNPTGYLYGDDVSMTTTGTPGTFANALSVASVDNRGFTGMYVEVGGSLIFYTETQYGNEPLATLAGERAYIYIDGFGTEEDFAALGDVLAGKIAVCSRGGISFYLKGENAVAAGAVGTIVYNNQAGSINMDLTDYKATAPLVSVTQGDGAILKDHATAVTGEDGEILYYEGTLTVGDQMATADGQPEYDTMSSFSSWGVPGSLQLKPEITAPGGNIYSVNGQEPGGQAYENMSGTSMAAPQVAGMVALLAEYIRENDLTGQTGLTARQLAQSLLMSTAEPLREEASGGNYWSVLRQGAGLANVGAAISAGVYVKMDESASASAGDYKVKAELGDDPERTGVYSVAFTLNNLTDADQGYTLASDFFTQDLFEYEGVTYLDTWTTPLSAEVTYLADGVVFVPTAKLDCDLDGDGDTDALDAQVILDYAAGLRTEIPEPADVDGDGVVTTRDAYCILASLETAQITVPAGGSVEIQVNIVLPEDVKARLNADYEKGAYLEGYLYARPVSTEEGEIASTHSIPVLGFYGNWSQPSMFDRITYTGYLYGDETAPYLGYAQTNNLIIKHKGDAGAYYQVGNPYMLEETYPEGKAAIRSSDTLYQYRLSLIRNAAALTVAVTNQEGDVLYLGNVFEQAGSAYYYTNRGTWMDTVGTYTMNRRVSSLGVREGDVLQVSVVAIPEYYETDGKLTASDVKELMSSGALGEGAYLTTTLTVDDTAPEMTEVSKNLTTGDLTVTARDNQYIAAVQVLNAAGSKILASGGVTQEAAGEESSVTIDLSQVKLGPTCMVRVADYAGNESLYTVEYGGEPEDYTGKMYGFTATEKYRGGGVRWMEIEPEKVCYQSETEYDGTTNLAAMDITVTAAEYVDGYVYMAADDGFLYAAPQGEWDDYVEVGQLGAAILDMAFSYAGRTLYALGEGNQVYTVDLVTGELTEAFTVSVTNPASTSATYKALKNLAIDDEGNFYAVNYSTSASYTFLYRWSLADVQEGAVTDLAPLVNAKTGSAGYTNKFGTLAWDHDKDILYWANVYSVNSQSNNLLYFDLETGKAQKTNPDYYLGKYPAAASRLYVQTTGLYIVPSGASCIRPSEEATRITLSETELTLLPGSEFTLSSAVYPWTLKDKSVTWATTDGQVVTVEEGVLFAVAEGQAVITATTNAEPKLSASCTVTVQKLPELQLSGLIYDKDGKTHWAEFSTDAPEAWQPVSDGQGSYYGGALLEELVYVHDGSNVYGIDPDTFGVKDLGPISDSWIWSDAAPAPAMEGGYFGRLIAPCDSGTKLEMLAPEEGTLSYWSLSADYQTDPMAAIAYTGSGLKDEKYPAASYFVLTENGGLWQFEIYTKDEGKSYTLERTELGRVDLELGNVSDVTGGAWASMLYDNDSGYLLLTSYMEGMTAKLYAIDPVKFVVTQLGEFGGENWPVVSLYRYSRVTELTVRMKPTHAAIYEKDTVSLQARVLPDTYEDGVVWTSSDPTVATVDEKGLVTGVREGTAVITATSLAKNEGGDTASASATVTVKPLLNVSTTVSAQITDGTGSHWITLDTADTEHYTVNADTELQLTAGGYHEGKLYGVDGDYVQMCNIYEIDPANGFRSTMGAQCSAGYTFLDLTAAPPMDLEGTDSDKNPITVTAFGGPMFISNARSIVFLNDYSSGTITVPSFNIASKYPDVAAVAFLGTTLYRDKWPAQDYMILCADGNLAMLEIYATYVSSESRVGYTLRQKVVGNVGKKFANDHGLAMTYVNDGTNEGLVVAYSDGGAELYYIDLTAETLSIGKLGNVGTATAIAVPYVTTNPPESSIIFSVREGTAEVCSTAVPYAQADGVEAPLADTASGTTVSDTGEAGGTLQAIHGAGEQGLIRPQSTDTAAEAGVATLTLTEDQTVTNGLIRVRFDPEVLHYESLATDFECFAVHEATGEIVFAYATASAAPAGAALAELRFTYEGEYVRTELQVETLQRNEDFSPEEPVTVKLEQEDGGHAYEVTSETAPTCTEAGSRTYTCPKCGSSYTESLEALGHDFGDWAVTLPAGCFREGLETRSCTRCGETETRAIPAGVENCPSKGFADVDSRRWYHQGIDYAVETGLMLGESDTLFGVHHQLTRGQLVTILYRMAGAPQVEGDMPFLDVAQGRFYYNAIAWAWQEGIAQGVTDTRFQPNAPVTREQLAVFLYRYDAAGEVDPGVLEQFPDGAEVSAYARSAMAWAVSRGLLIGDETGSLQPAGTATRAQTATILMRYCTAE